MYKRQIFNGNGYSADWIAEAARRGLPNLPSMVSSVPSLTTDKAVQLFGKFGVFTRAELESRSEIMYETYTKVISIEARTMLHLSLIHIFLQFCRCGGLWNAKGHPDGFLSHFSSLRNFRLSMFLTACSAARSSARRRFPAETALLKSCRMPYKSHLTTSSI